MPRGQKKRKASKPLPCGVLESQDLVDEVGRAIIRSNEPIHDAAMRFANWNCSQKTRCSPAVYREACALFGLVCDAGRDYLLVKFQTRITNNPYKAAGAAPKDEYAPGATNPSSFSHRPWLDRWQSCFNACSYMVRWAAASGWADVNAPVLELLRRAAAVPLSNGPRRDAAFLSITREIINGTVEGSFTNPARWLLDVAVGATATDEEKRPIKAFKRWAHEVSHLGGLFIRPNCTEAVRAFLWSKPHYNVNCYVPVVQPATGARPAETRWVRPITLAIILAKYDLFCLFVDRGADLNARTFSTPNGDYFETPLLASVNRHSALNECLRLTVEPSVDIMALRTDGSSVLHLLVQVVEWRVPGLQTLRGPQANIGYVIEEVMAAVRLVKKRCLQTPGHWTKLRRARNLNGESALDRLTTFWMRGVGGLNVDTIKEFSDKVGTLATVLFEAW